MSRANNDAYSAACKAAHEIFLSCAASIQARIAAGEISRDESGYSDDLTDAIHEETNNACIYTSDAWILAYGLREADMTDFGAERHSPFSGHSDINGCITAQAYANLCEALQGHDFDDAFTVAEDKAAESNPPETDAHEAHADFYDLSCAECMEEKKIAIEKGKVTP